MKILKLFSNTFNVIEQGLNYSSLKQKAIAQNIANVDTPNYQSTEVKFKDQLNQSMKRSFNEERTHTRHIPIEGYSTGQSTFAKKSSVQYNHNGNGVDMDKEMADLATNQLYFHSLTEQLNHQFKNMQTVIRGGR
ncbi:flagellar basal body rod protein FlgB [Bacillus sp. 2205SS5-2]|uniref:flagellar basal body rod protein FlgB n=1 Tax=Bacillus sp. 2205SS5-2 TaxID=3109031 RepID=UPI003006562F